MKKDYCFFATVLMIMFSSEILSQETLLEGLVSYWKFDEGVGSQTIDSKSSNDGVLEGDPSWYTNGIIHNAISFDGNNDYLEIQDHNGNHNIFEISNAFTHSAWVKLSSDYENRGYIFHNQGSASSVGGRNGGTALYINDDKKVVAFAGKGVSGSNNRSVTSQSHLETESWVFITCVMDNDQFSIYIDGALDATTTIASGNVWFSQVSSYRHTNVWIGARPLFQVSGVPVTPPYQNQHNFNGVLDEISIWNRALSSDEISMLFNNGIGLQYPFDQTSPINYISNIQISPRIDGSGYVDIYFDLFGASNHYNIALEVSFDGGSTYTAIPATFLSGDVNNISPGINKYIVWDGLGSHPNTFSTATKLKITAN